MTTLFNLKTSMADVSSSNSGRSKVRYQQVAPSRNVVRAGFSTGSIKTQFEMSGTSWWIPSQTYIRMRCSLKTGDDTALLTNTNNIAPNMGLMANLFQSGEFRIANTTVSRISDFMPQIDALENRLLKSDSWLSSIGKSSNYWSEDVYERMADITSDGVVSGSSKDVTTTGRLALGIDPLTSVEWTSATDTLEFTLGTVPDMSALFPVGSLISFPVAIGAEVAGTNLLVVGGTATTLIIEGNNDIGADVATAVLDFNKVEPEKKAGRRAGEFELCWQPPMSIFKIDHALPAGDYELVLNPQTSTEYQKMAIESLLATKVPDTDFKFSVVDMYLEVATVEGSRVDDVEYLLDLSQTRCQSEDVSNVSFTQKNFDVSPASYALTLAYQDSRVGSDTQFSASKFKAYNAAGTASVENALNRMFINYAGESKPSPDASPEFATGTDHTVQRYYESQINSGALFDVGGSESIEKFHDRGSYYHVQWPKDKGNFSTRVNVHGGFTAGTDIATTRMLLFDHSKQIARVTVQNSRVVDVILEDN